MPQLKQTQSSLAEINMVPFIDVVLVLLIIFMITAPILQSGIEVDVPKTKTVHQITEQHLVITDVNSDGRQARQRSVERRSQRMFGVDASQIGVHQFRHLRARALLLSQRGVVRHGLAHRLKAWCPAQSDTTKRGRSS